MASRVFYYNSANNEVGAGTSGATTVKTYLNLTFTPEDNSEYFFIWNAVVTSGSLTTSAITEFRNSANTSLALVTLEAKDATDWMPIGGIANASFGVSPGQQSFNVAFSSSSATANAKIREAQIIAIKKGSNDFFTDSTANLSNTGTTFNVASTLTITSPIANSKYLFIGSQEVRFSTTTGESNTKLVVNGNDRSVCQLRASDAANYIGFYALGYDGDVFASNYTVTIQFARSATATGTAYCRNPRIMALRLNDFLYANTSTSLARQTTTSTTYAAAVSNAIQTLENQKYFVIGSAIRDHNNNGNSGYTRLARNTVGGVADAVAGDSLREPTVASTVIDFLGYGYFFVDTVKDGTNTWSVDYETESTSTGIEYSVISVMQLTDPVIGYWNMNGVRVA